MSFSSVDVASTTGTNGGFTVSLVGTSQSALTRMSLADAAQRITQLSQLAIPGADGVSLRVRRDGTADTIRVSTAFIEPADTIQWALGEGPSVCAAIDLTPVRSGSLGTDLRWPRLGAGVRHLQPGIRSDSSYPPR